MESVNIPGSDIEVTRLALGSWVFAGGRNWGDQDEGDSLSTVRAAVDSGIRFIDTAEAYGDGASEEIVG